LKAVAYASTDWTQLTKTQTKHRNYREITDMKKTIRLTTIVAALVITTFFTGCGENEEEKVTLTQTELDKKLADAKIEALTSAVAKTVAEKKIDQPTSPVAPDKKSTELTQEEKDLRARAAASQEEAEKQEREIVARKTAEAQKKEREGLLAKGNLVSPTIPTSPVRSGPAQNVGNQSFFYTFALPVAASGGSEQRTVTVKIDNQAWKVPDAEVRQNFLQRGATWEQFQQRQQRRY
jgi:hypothetical protein